MLHSEQINQLTNKMELMAMRKNDELQKYVEEVRACQSEIKKLNQEREKRWGSLSSSDANRHLNKDFSSEPSIDYQKFGMKNHPELQAELEYFVEKTKSQETELKTLNLELLYHRTEKEDVKVLRTTLEAAELQVRQLKNQNKNLTKLKEHFEKEYLI